MCVTWKCIKYKNNLFKITNSFLFRSFFSVKASEKNRKKTFVILNKLWVYYISFVNPIATDFCLPHSTLTFSQEWFLYRASNFDSLKRTHCKFFLSLLQRNTHIYYLLHEEFDPIKLIGATVISNVVGSFFW